MKRRIFSALLAAGLAATPAVALPTDWQVQATFDDGTILSGVFDIGFYTYIGPSTIDTQAKGAFAATTYSVSDPDTSSSNDEYSISIEPGPYTGRLYLRFADSLFTSEAMNAIITGGTSFECQGGYGCTNAATPDDTVHTRYVVSGFASPYVAPVPEPATWVTALLGFGLAGTAMRRRLSRTACRCSSAAS